MENGKWLNEKEVSELTGISLQTLRNRRWNRIGIPFYKTGRSVRYKLSDVLKAMEAGRVEVRH